MSKKILALFIFAATSVAALSQEKINLWEPGRMPDNKGFIAGDSIVKGQLYSVAEPSVYLYPADPANNTGCAVVIIPGGGYLRHAGEFDKVAAADFYQRNGISAFVVNYRLPGQRDVENPDMAPRRDIQRAMRVVRANAGRPL